MKLGNSEWVDGALHRFAAVVLIAAATLIFPIRNAEPINTPELKADANETAVGSSNAAAQASIAAGANHTCALSSGAVKCWGDNTHGQLGNGNTSSSSTPVGVSGLSSGVTAITAAYSYTCALSSGAVKCWGRNLYGELGNGSTSSSSTPVDVHSSASDSTPLSGVTAITASLYHTCALLSSGAVKCWGLNNYGQLGNGNKSSSSTPVGVSGLSSGVTAITASYTHTCALLSSGAVKCWGDNTHGELGDGTTTLRTTPVNVLTAGTDQNSNQLTNVTAITAGGFHTCALLSSGAVKCWGFNADGELGNGSTSNSSTPVDVSGLSSGVTAITTGLYHTCALASGAVKCWGRNARGQLGDGTTTQRNTPVNVLATGSDQNSNQLTNVTAITAGENHTCALSTGAMQCWGYNPYGQLGDQSTTDRSNPVSVSGGLSFGPDTTSPTLSAAAVNSAGKQLILQFNEQISSTTASASNFAVTVAGASRSVSSVAVTGSTVVLTLASAVSPGQSVSVAYTAPASDSSTSNAAIQDSSGNDAASFDTSSGAVTVANHHVAAQQYIAAGGNHTCALSSGAVNCWGSNGSGQLGDGTYTTRSTPGGVSGLSSGVTAIAANSSATCALLTSGAVKCWGYDFSTNSSTPVEVSGLSSGVTAIAGSSTSGRNFMCALLSTGAVKCWGENTYGRLGNGSETNSSTPVDVSGLSGVVAITAGADHSCALLSTGAVKCWGRNGYGEFGNGTTTTSSTPVDVSGLSGVTAITAGNGFTCALLTSGAVKCWGKNDFGQLGDTTRTQRTTPVDVSGLSGVTAMTARHTHTCALLSTGAVKCWGVNDAGQLGDGTTTQRTTPVNVLTAGTDQNSNQLTNVTAINAGVNHTCALLSTGAMQCWGYNNTRQLGDGTTTTQPNPVTVTGGHSFGSDATAPTFVSAAVNTAGTKVILTYSEALSATTADASAFSILVGGSSRSVSSVAVSGSTVELTLASAVATGQSVTVAYTDPNSGNDANAVQDSAGNDAATLAATSVTNNADSVSPSFVSAATNSAGDQVTLTFGETLSSTTAGASAFSVVVNGVAVTPSSVTVSGSTVVLAVSPAIQSGDTVTFAYTDPTDGNDTNAVQDSIGNDVGSISATSVTNSSTVDTRTPTFVSAATSADGTTITLTYSEALSATTASSSAFAVVVGGSSRSVSSAVVSGSTVVLTLGSAVAAGESVTVAYTDPTAGNDTSAVQDSAGNDAGTLAATSVTNNVPTPTTTTTIAPTSTVVPSATTTTTTSTTTSTTSTTSTTTTTVAPTSTVVPSATTTSTTTVRSRRTTTTTLRQNIAPTTSSPASIVTRPVTLTTTTSTSTTSTTSTSTTSTSTTSTTTTTVRPIVVTTTPRAPETSLSTSSTVATLPLSTTTTLARATVERLRVAQEQTSSLAQQSTAANTNLRTAREQLAEATLAVLDPKSAIVVAMSDLAQKLEQLQKSDATAAQIREVAQRIEALNTAVIDNVAVSVDAVAAAQDVLAAVLADPTSTEAEIAVARATLTEARTPDLAVVEEVLGAVPREYWAPIAIPGVVDQPRAGNVVFLDNSESKSMQLVRVNNTALQLQSNEGFALTITTRDKNGVPFQLGEGGSIVVKHGNFVAIAGQGFAGGTMAKTWLFSSPRELGSIDVASDGSFSAEHPIGDDVKVGVHTAQVNGLSPTGETRSLSITVEVLPNEGPAPFDPLAKRSDVVQLTAELLTLAAVAGAASGGSRRSRSNDDDDSDDDTERDAADVNELSTQRGSIGLLARVDRITPPTMLVYDSVMQMLGRFAAARSALLARVIGDGAYLRALTGIVSGLLPLIGILLGVLAARDVEFVAGVPSLWLVIAIVLVGALDAFGGFAATLSFVVAVSAAGGIASADSVRGILGFAVLAFGVPIVAGATRPFRRESYGDAPVWGRVSDAVVLSLVGAWGAGSMFSALPGLFGFTYADADRIRLVQAFVLVALVARYMLEQAAAALTANRLASLEVDIKEPATARRLTASLLQTALFVFVAVVFIGNNWALWLGAVLYLTPKVVGLVNDRLPQSARLEWWLPKGITRIVIMLVVAKWWANLLDNAINDAATMLRVGFVALGLPALVLTALGWFAGGAPKRASTPITRIAGVIVLIVGVLIVLGVINP